MKWIHDQFAIIVLLLLSSMTIFGLELPSGQQIILDGEPFIVGRKLGTGGSAEIYLIVSASNPSRRYVMRSPRFHMENSEESAWYDEVKFKKSIAGLNLISSIPLSRTKWRWAPKVVVAELNPHRHILEVEKTMGWDKTHREPVAIIPLAKESLMDHVESEEFEAKTFSEKVALALSIYADLIPEMKNLLGNKLIHGDIKPANILLDDKGKAGLSDFEGVIRQGERGWFLTTDFAAPEALLFDHPSFAADFYSLGKTLLYILMNEEHLSILFDSKDPFEDYRKLFELLNQFERTISLDPDKYPPQAKELINFLKTSLEPDPTKRILGMKTYVPSLKDIEPPKDFKMRAYLKTQSLLIKSTAVINNAAAKLKAKLFAKRKSAIVNPGLMTTTTYVDNYLKSNFTFELENTKTPISKSSDGTMDKAWRQAASNSPEAIEKILRILSQQADKEMSDTLGLLEIVDSLDHKKLLKQRNIMDFVSFPDFEVKRYFTQLFIRENFNLDRLTEILVDQSLMGDNSLLLEHLSVLKPFITSAQYHEIFKASTDHDSYASADNKAVIVKLGKLPGSFRNFVPIKDPNYTLEEITGVYRYRQPQPEVRSCLRFYKNAQ